MGDADIESRYVIEAASRSEKDEGRALKRSKVNRKEARVEVSSESGG